MISPEGLLRKAYKIIALGICFCLFFEQSGFTQGAAELNISFHLSQMAAATSTLTVRQEHLRALLYDVKKNQLRFAVDRGERVVSSAQALIKNFFVGIVIPNDTFWVNLRPDAASGMIDPLLEQTDLGKTLLEADLQLKKDLAFSTNPQTPAGKLYWDGLYKKAGELYGADNITIPTLTRVWIVPGKIVIAQTNNGSYIYKATLKVMLEQDYLKDAAGSRPLVTGQDYTFKDERSKALNEYSSQLIRELIIPQLTKEVNTAERYAALRQVYYSLILAQCFKAHQLSTVNPGLLANSSQIAKLINSKNLVDLTSKEPWDKETYFQEYKDSFRKGEYNIQEAAYSLSGKVIRSYFSGGVNFELFSAGSPVKPGVTVIESNLPFAPPLFDGAFVVDEAGKPSLISGSLPVVNRLKRPFTKAMLAIILALTLLFSSNLVSDINAAAQHSAPPAPRAGTLLPTPEQLNPVDSNIPPQLLQSPKLRPYYEIVRNKDKNSIPRLLLILKQHDNSKWEGFSLGALFKAVIPMGGVPKPPTYQIEASVGNLLSLLRSGYQHLMARFDTADQSEQAAAAWALGEMAPFITKPFVVTALAEAMAKKTYPSQVRAAAADSIRKLKQRGHISIGAIPGVSTQDAREAMNDPEWLVRFYMAEAIDAKDFPQVQQLVFDQLKEESHPYVVLALVEAAFRLKGFGAVLPVIQATKNLKFSPSEDQVLFAVDSVIWQRIAGGLANFARQSPDSRRYLLAMFAKELHYLQSARSQDKYDILNYNLIPLFEQFVRQLRINRGEIGPLLSGLDPRVARAILNIIEPKQRALPPFPSLGQAEEKYQRDLQEIKSKNPALVKVIQHFEQRQDRTSLYRILIFAQNTAVKALAADALYRIADVSSMRVLVAGLSSSHPTVRAADARALCKLLSRWQFVYTGKEGSLIKALDKAVQDRDWVTAGYLIYALTAIGDADALEPITSALNSDKNRFIQMFVLEALAYFRQEGSALTGSLGNLLTAKDTDLDVLIRSMQLAAVSLTKSDDPALVDRIIEAVLAFPIKIDSSNKVRLLYQEARKALRNSRYARECLQQRYDRELGAAKGQELEDYNKVNSVKALMEGLGSFQKKSGQKDSKAETLVSLQFAQAYPVMPGTVVSDALPSYGEAGRKPYPRVRPQEANSQQLAATTGIEKQLMAIQLLRGNTDSATRLRIIEGLGGLSIAYPPGKHPLVDALYKIAVSESEQPHLRKRAVAAIVRIRVPESSLALTRLLAGVGVNELDMMLAVIEAAENMVLGGSKEKGLIDGLLNAFLKLTIEPETIRAYPQINTAYIKLVQLIQKNPAYGFEALNIKLSDLLGKDEYKTRLILFIGHLADEQRYKELTRKALGRDSAQPQPKAPGIFTHGSRIENMLQEFAGASELKKIAMALAVFKGLSDNTSPRELAEAFAFFGNIDEKYMHPAVIRLAVNMVAHPRTEDSRIAASYFLTRINLENYYHIDLYEHAEVKGLTNGLKDSNMGFDERLSRIDALGREASPYIVEPLISAYYEIMENIYREIESSDSNREKERMKLVQAIVWALEKVKDSAVDKIRITLDGRLNKLNYTDCTLMTFLGKYAPKDAKALLDKMRLKAVNLDPFELLGPYYRKPASGSDKRRERYYDKEREISRGLFAGLKEKILVPSLSKDELNKLKSVPGYFERISNTLLHDLNNPDEQAIAAHRLGELRDWRSRLILTAALFIDDRRVAANIGWALAQYEIPAGQPDPAVEAIKQKLSQTKDPFERAMLAFAIGSLGGVQIAGEKQPAAISLAIETLTVTDEGERIFAAVSAGKLAIKFKSSVLGYELLKVVDNGFKVGPERLKTAFLNFPTYILTGFTLPYEYSPSAQAAADAFNALTRDKTSRVILAGIDQQLASENIKDILKSTFLPDIRREVLEQCMKRQCSVYEAVGSLRWKYWLPKLPLIIIILTGIGWFLITKAIPFFRTKAPRTLGEDEAEKPVRRKRPPPSSSPIDRDSSSSAVLDKVYNECQRSLQAIHALLKGQYPADEKFSAILTEYYLIVNYLPIATAEGKLPEELYWSKELKRRSDFLTEALNLLVDVKLQLDSELVSTQERETKQQLYNYRAEWNKYFEYLSLYWLAIGSMKDLISAAPYGSGDKTKGWVEAYGWQNFGDRAQKNLANLLKKIYKSGNEIVGSGAYFYTLPTSDKEYTRIAGEYRKAVDLSPIEPSSDEELGARREFTRVKSPLIASVTSALISFTVTFLMVGGMPEGWQVLLGILPGAFFGYFYSIVAHRNYMNRAGNRQSEFEEKDRQELMDSKDFLERLRQENPYLQAFYQTSMLEAQKKACEEAFVREIDMANEPTADVIFVMTGERKNEEALKKDLQGLTRKDTPIFTLDNSYFGGAEVDSGDAFLRLYSLFDPDSSFAQIFNVLVSQGGVVCLNKGDMEYNTEKRARLAGHLRPIVLYAARQPYDLRTALGNGYRITQTLHAQGKTRIVNINADIRYTGPIWNFGEEDFTEITSWASLKGMRESQAQGRQLGLAIIGRASRFIEKFYEKFNFGYVSDWLDHEIKAGRYDMNNSHKLQFSVLSGIWCVSINKGLYKIIRAIREYKQARSNSGKTVLPLHLGSDIKVLLMMLSEDLSREDIEEDIDKYFIMYLRHYAIEHAKEHHKIEINKKEAREFYEGLLEAMRDNYPKDRKFLFGAQVIYPHESSLEMVTVVSSPVVAAVSHGSDVGGIDLRLQDSMFQTKGGPGSWQPEFMPLASISYDEEWLEIMHLLRAGIRPSRDRIVQYLNGEKDKTKLLFRLQNVRFCMAKILKQQETDVQDPGDENWTEDLLELVESKGCGASFQ